MPLLIAPYIWPLLLSTVLSIILMLIMFQRRMAPGALALAILMLGTGIWSLAYAVSLLQSTFEGQLFWVNVMYIGVVAIPSTWLIFALHYAGQRSSWPFRRLLFLLPMPLLTLIMVWTNESHELFRKNARLVPNSYSVTLQGELGPAFWVHTAYSYALILIGTALLIYALLRTRRTYRRQAGMAVVGLLLPIIGNALYLSGINPFPEIDITPFIFTLSGAALAWDLMRYRLFDLVPVARDTIIEELEVGVIVLDTQDRIVDINPSALRIIRMPDSNVLGKPMAEILVARPDILERYRHVAILRDEITVAHRTFDLHIAPIPDRHGQPNGRIIMLHDITAQKQTAAELRHQNEQLAALAESNALLYETVQMELSERKRTEEALQQAKEVAEIASRAKSHFLANMSHELRTPLNAILGYTYLIKREFEEAQDTRYEKDLESIERAGQQLLELISNILDLSRIEANRFELHIEHFALNEFIKNTADTMQPLIQRNQNQLILQIEGAQQILYTDQLRLRQILLNLLSNAAKFTEKGQIILSAEPVIVEQQELIRFTVSDTGIGMSPEQQKLLFHEYTQVAEVSAQRQGGSGLGLIISRRLCQLLGGDISVLSRAGEGTTFSFVIPAHYSVPKIESISQ